MPELGRRVEDARRRAGLDRRTLARRLGVPYRTVERLERGETDVRRYLPQIAEITGDPTVAVLPEEVVLPGSDSRTARAAELVRSTRTSFAPPGTRLVIGSLTVLLLIRFFTEGIHVLPKATTFVDVPIYLLLVAVAASRGRAVRPSRSFFIPAVAFLVLAVVAAVANPSRIAPAPAIVFVYDFLSPLGVYYAVYRLWPPGNSFAFSRLLVTIGVINFLVVGGVDLPKFLAHGNPDDVSGTFGDNAYQLVFFLIVLTALIAAIGIFERRRAAARFAPLMFIAIAAIIFLAQYRAIIITAMISIVAIAFFLVKARPGSGLVIGTIVVVAFLGSLNYVAAHFPKNKLTQAVSAVQSNPWFFVSARLHSADDVASMFSDNPRYIVTGSGPGTFSSRAWYTFANLQMTRTAVAAPYAKALNGGTAYESDVAEKYTLPRLQSAPIVQGSHAVTSPLSSYTSLLAEVGVLGFLVYVGIYLLALGRAASMLMRAMRRATPGDPLPALALAATIAFLVLLQLAALENWLEVTRITFLSWAMLAVVARESDHRAQQSA